MAKGRRKRSEREIDWPSSAGDGGDEGQEKKPPAARPVEPTKPPAAKPVQPSKPPAARPVQPSKPPAAKPVQPSKPPAARPVQPSQPPAARPAKPATARPAAPSGGGGGSRGGSRGRAAREETIERPSRAASRRGGHGMSLAMKVALLAGLATLVVIAAAVFAPSGGDAVTAADVRSNAGYAAVQALAGTDPDWWVGGGGMDPVRTAKAVLIKLFGEQGRSWWEETRSAITEPDYENMEGWEREEAQEAREKFLQEEEKLAGGAGDGPTKEALASLARIVRTPAATGQDYRILAAWVREVEGGAEGDYVAYSIDDTGKLRYTFDPAPDGTMPGEVAGSPVTIYTAPMGTPSGRGNKPLRAYVALWKTGGGGGGVGGLGIVMLILGPLVVGAVAGAVAGSHTRSVRDLAREIDRLGTAGDASRSLRASGTEAAAIARSVERMVGNLEFRSKHGDDDLDEIADREKKIAAEIHGALMSKNPPRLSNYEVETLFKPGFEIGGDHFEYFRIDDDHLGLILLDTNVRGIQAALVMSAAKAYVRAAAPGITSPAEVLRKVNRDLAGDLPPGRHVTALYVVLDTQAGKATIASAGHLPLLVYRHKAGTMAKVNPEGIALGLDVGPVFDRSLQEGDLPIDVGDRIVLYTDGALNIENEEGEEFGEERFYAAVSREAPKNSQAFVNFVGGAIDQFHLGAPQNDDVTISTVKRLK